MSSDSAMRALVIEPGHGSLWLDDARYVEGGAFIEGKAWDDGDRGSALMPDDYMGEEVTLTFPVNLIVKIEGSPA